MTELVTVVSVAADVGIAIGTFTLAAIAYTQLKELNNQQKIIGEREKQWQTISICQKYFNDPVLLESKRAIWAARKNGTTEIIDEPGLVRQDALFILNYFDTIAIGIEQGVFIKSIVKDNLGPIMIVAVKRFLENESGAFNLPRHHLPSLLKIVEEFRASPLDHKAVS